MSNLSDLRDGIAKIIFDSDIDYYNADENDYLETTDKILKYVEENLKVKVICPKMNHFDTTDKHDVEWFKGCPDCKGTLYITKTLKEMGR